MVNLYAAFGHDFLKVAIINSKTDIEENGIQDDTFGEMSTFEVNCHFYSPQSISHANGDIAQQK